MDIWLPPSTERKLIPHYLIVKNYMFYTYINEGSGQLFIVRDKSRYGALGAVDIGRGGFVFDGSKFVLAKYSNQVKCELPDLNYNDIKLIAETFGLEVEGQHSHGVNRISASVTTTAMQALLTWSSKHPILAKRSHGIYSLVNQLRNNGITPLTDSEYTGW